MTQIATREHANGNASLMQAMAQPAPRFDLPQMWQMAEYIAASGLFGGCKMTEQAFTLMMICDSEGLHPIQAMRRYHIIPSADGPRATMRSDAMQAEFQSRGGVIAIVRSSTTEARAWFSHPLLHPEPVEMAVTYEECIARGITKGREGEKKNWRESRKAMLWARLVTMAIRMIYPGIVAGIYSPEEIEDMEDHPKLLPETVARLEAPAAQAPQRPAQFALSAFRGEGYDDRNYKRAAGDEAEASNREFAEFIARNPRLSTLKVRPLMAVDIHRKILNAAIQKWPELAPFPAKMGEAVAKLDGLYKTEETWVREAIRRCVIDHETERDAAVEAAIQAQATSPGPSASDSDDDIVSDPDDDNVANNPADA